MTFEQWKSKVDQHLINLCGMTSEDIDDWNYYDAWEDNVPPLHAAKHAMKAAMASYCW